MLQYGIRARTMATTNLTDQERALLAQFVASNTSNPADAPILIQYAMDRLARGGSTLAEVVQQLSPNGLDAAADYGPYLDVVNRTLGPQVADTPQADFGGGGGSPEFDFGAYAPRGLVDMGQGNPIATMLDRIFQPKGEAPSRVHVANLDPLPVPTPAADTPIRSAPVPAARPAPIPDSPAPAAQPIARRPEPVVPRALPENVPGPNGYSSSTKDQSRLTTVGDLAFEPRAAAPVDLIERTMASLSPAGGPFKAANAGDDLAVGPVRGIAVPSIDAGRYTGPEFSHGYQRNDDPRYASVVGAEPFQAVLPDLPPSAPLTRLDAVANNDPKQRLAPTPATMSPELRQSVSAATGGMRLSDNDRELLARAVATEVDPRIARTNPEAYALQVQRVTDTILNRVASPDFPDTVAGVLNQNRQFSAIAGPTGRPGEHYGAVENIPASRADQGLREILSSYLDQRVSGAVPSSVGGALNYANPGVADASNMRWINNLNMAVDDAGPFSHRYGVAQGYQPFEATFVNPALDAANALAGGTIGGFVPPTSRLSNSTKQDEKQIRVKADPISDAWTAQALTPRTDRLAPAAAQKQPQQIQRDPFSQSWTQPQAGASDRARMAQAAAQSPGARQAASPGKISASNNFSSNSGGSSATGQSSFTGSNTGSSGSRTATGSTSSSSKNSTTPSKTSSPTSSVSSSKTSSSSSSKTSNSSKSSSDKSSSSSGRMNAGMY